jgi:hypothetical protein
MLVYAAANTKENDCKGQGFIPGFGRSLRLALLFACIKFVFHVITNLWQAHLGWGYFRDEPYYILCGQHLDWGYVDHGPVVALQARLAVLLFGKSLAGIRMFASLAGAAKILLIGLLARQLGAGAIGQVVAMTAALFCPEFLAVDSYLSMNVFEPVFWMTAAMSIVQLLKGGSRYWWLAFGAAAGIGCENKPSMVFFLAALLLGLLLTEQRRMLVSRWMLLGIALSLALVVPNLLWQHDHQWATLQFLHNAKAAHLLSTPSILRFYVAQAAMLGVASLPVVGAGLLWLLTSQASARYRFLGFTYVFFLIIMTILREAAKEYYLTPIYPILFAAGGAAWELYACSRRNRWLIPAYVVFVVLVGLIGIPTAVPVMRPQACLRYLAATHLRSRSAQKYGPFSAFFAMRFDWQELTDDVTRIYRSLPSAEQAQAGIFTSDYGTASAINFLGTGRGLPIAISGHNNYFLWGPHGETGSVMIVVTTATMDELLQEYDSVERVGTLYHPYGLRWETAIYLCHGRKTPFSNNWATLKRYE